MKIKKGAELSDENLESAAGGFKHNSGVFYDTFVFSDADVKKLKENGFTFESGVEYSTKDICNRGITDSWFTGGSGERAKKKLEEILGEEGKM